MAYVLYLIKAFLVTGILLLEFFFGISNVTATVRLECNREGEVVRKEVGIN